MAVELRCRRAATLRRPVRRPRRPRRRRCCARPATPEESFADDPLRMLRAARFAAQLGLTLDAARGRGDDRDGRRSWRGSPPERVQDELIKLMLGADPRARDRAARRHRPRRRRAARAARAAAGDRRAPPAQGRLHALPDRAGAGDRRSRPAGPDLVLRLAALLHDIGKPKTRRNEPGGRVSFHHHEVVGAKLTRKPAARAALPEGRGRRRVAAGRSCTCASTATAPGSGPTRRCAATSPTPGPLLDRLHALVRSDCTTRNKRRAAALQRSYDSLEQRIAAAARAGGARRDPARPRRQRDHGAARHPARARWWGRPTSTCWRCGWSAARWAREEAEAELRRWAAENGVRARRRPGRGTLGAA